MSSFKWNPSKLAYLLALLPLCLFAEESRSLPELIQEALSHNCGLQSYREKAAAACHYREAQARSFLPEIGVEGGAYSEDLHIREDSYNYAFVKANWNLYRGGADAARLGILESEKCMAELTSSKAAKELSFEVSEAFYHLIYYDAALASYRETLKQNEVYEHQAHRKWESGLTSEVDKLEFQLRADSLRTEINLLEGERYLQHTQLLTLVGCPEMEASFLLQGGFLSPTSLDVDQLFDQALCQREEKQMAQHQQRIRCLEARQVDSEFLPSVDLYASYGYEPDSPEDRSHGSRIGLNISMPLFDGGVNYHKRQAASRIQKAETFAHCQLDTSIYREISVATMKARLTQESLTQARSRLAKLTDYWDATSEEYQRGIKNSPDLAAAADQVLQAKLKVLELQRDYSLGLVHLSEVVGALPPLPKY